ncbi:hypothetical protein VD0002_g8369 [Verticillium dahliae]|nr:hypothetical protein VD0002_g8369 [Verticillium dahliae]
MAIMSEYTLYTYFPSSSSARLRIALNHKQIPHPLHPVNLLKNEPLADAHRALNPSATVPLLVREQRDAPSATPLRITQSLAALEYLDEAHPSTPHLLPRDDPDSRAAARALAGIIASDTQPVTNLRIVRRVRALGGDAEAWMRELMADGLAAYEAVAAASAGRCSVGDDLSLADCCLMPALWNAERYGVDLAPYPTIRRVRAYLDTLPAVVQAGYYVQPDCPADLRVEPSEQ